MNKAGLFLFIAMITGFAIPESKAVTQIEIVPSASLAIEDTLTYYSVVPDSTVSHSSKTKKHKLIPALLALPFPCGFVGAHRVMMGTSPWVPVVYVATLGGCFGILPLIDFCFIVASKNSSSYENNPHVFMWLK